MCGANVSVIRLRKQIFFLILYALAPSEGGGLAVSIQILYPQISQVNADFKRGNLDKINLFLKDFDSLFSELTPIQKNSLISFFNYRKSAESADK